MNHEIDAKTFLDTLFDLDQSTFERSHASANLEVLLSDDIKGHFQQNPEYQDEYYHLLSLTYFHLGQQLVNNDLALAKEYFQKSVDYIERIDWDDEGLKQDRLYRQATLAYLEHDLERLAQLYQQMEDGDNKNIIANMIYGLKNYGDINYGRDYNNGPALKK